jgi:predicted phage terminase large subunit-like protein
MAAKLEERRIKKLASEERKKLKQEARLQRKRDLRKRKVREAEKAKEVAKEDRRASFQVARGRRRVNLVKRELAARTLAQRHLMAFVMRQHRGYQAGLFHRDVCRRLDKFAKDVIAGKSPRLILQAPPRHGKQIADDTPVLTTKGWTTHGALRTGDEVFGPDGVPTQVVAVGEPALQNCEVEFTDGSVVRTHENHEWTVYDRCGDSGWRTVETKYLEQRTLWSGPRGKRGGRAALQLPHVHALQLPEAALPLDPYVLGVWLGDGRSCNADFCWHADDAAVAVAVNEAQPITRRWVHRTTGVNYGFMAGVKPILRRLGVLNAKHVPAEYELSSIEQRLALLAGLIDTDGHVELGTQRVRIATVSDVLASGIERLVRSLGWRANRYTQQPALSTSGVQGRHPVHYVSFTPDRAIPTRLPRKRIVARESSQRRLGIAAVRRGAPAIGRCIQVARADGLYLVGEQLIPTHNSLLASVYFPAWFLGNNPDKEIIATSYSGSLALTFSRKVRELLREQTYQAVFPRAVLDKDNQNAEGWMTTRKGGYVPAGVGGAITGKGAHILVIDDPLKNAEDASSTLIKDSIWEWYTSTAYTRLAPGGGVIVIATRWAEDDLSGRLEALSESGEGDKFQIIRYPAIATEDEPYRKAGEALHPERYSVEQLRKIERAVGPSVWQALYQQQPMPDTGSYFTRDMFRWYTGAAPGRLAVYAGWDLAIGKGDRNDFTAGVVVGIDQDDGMWVLDVRHGRWDSFEIVEQMLDVQRVWKPEVHGIEKSQVSMAIGPYLEQRMYEDKAYEMVVRDLPPGRRDKELRARAIQGRMRQGRVQFPKDKHWADGIYAEMLKFPNGAHDDRVDALAWIGLMLQEMNVPLEPREPEYAKGSWKEKLEKLVNNPTKRGSMAA